MLINSMYSHQLSFWTLDQHGKSTVVVLLYNGSIV
nr:MAG TPA: hypothetical protein [Caudoviricetes sp.]